MGMNVLPGVFWRRGDANHYRRRVCPAGFHGVCPKLVRGLPVGSRAVPRGRLRETLTWMEGFQHEKQRLNLAIGPPELFALLQDREPAERCTLGDLKVVTGPVGLGQSHDYCLTRVVDLMIGRDHGRESGGR